MGIVEYFQAIDFAEWRVVGSAPIKAKKTVRHSPASAERRVRARISAIEAVMRRA
jgi:hypothetical protein